MPSDPLPIRVNRPTYIGQGTWTLELRTDLLVVFGRNSSGKSVFLRSLRDQDPERYHYVSPERAGKFEFGYQFVQEQVDAKRRENRYQSNYAQTYREDVVSRVQAYLAKRGSPRSGQLVGDLDETERLFTIATRDFALRIVAGIPPYEIRRLANDIPLKQGAQELSSGESELIGITLDLLMTCSMWEIDSKAGPPADSGNRVLLVDEPDTHLHPDLQQSLADFLVRLTVRFGVRVIVATHSTTLLAALGQYGGSQTSVTFLNNATDRQDVVEFDTYLKELTTCLGGHALIGPLFGLPILLVEGDDDYRLWSEVPRRGITRFAVIPCNGEEIVQYQRRLERLFASLRDPGPSPVGYALRDGDTRIPEPGPASPQQHVRYLQLACRESENLYLTDEVLQSIDTTWNDARSLITERASNFGNKRETLEGADSWDRLTTDLKPVINELSVILDKKNVHWTQRVGRVIGARAPTGQLRQYLGDVLVGALWPARTEPPAA